MLAGIKYVLKNLFKPIALVLTIYLLLGKSPDDVLDSGFWGIALLFFLCINVVTVYDFGEFYVIFAETGVSLAVGLIFYFLFQGLVVWLVTNGVIVAGILIILYAVNRAIDAVKYLGLTSVFFTIVGFVFAGLVLIDGIVLMCNDFDFDTVGSFLLIANIPVVILQIINMFVHATYADAVED